MGALFPACASAFHLYVPAGMVDVARRLCQDNQIHVDEIWSYHTFGDEVRFTNVHRSREPPAGAETTSPGLHARTAPAPRRKNPPARAEARQAGKGHASVSKPQESRPRRRSENSWCRSSAFHVTGADTNTSTDPRRPTARLAPTRILYWYRTPPGHQGRQRGVRRRGQTDARDAPSWRPFDWPRLLETRRYRPPRAENWRERRRVERSARQAATSRGSEEPPWPSQSRSSPPPPVVPERSHARGTDVEARREAVDSGRQRNGEQETAAARRRRRRRRQRSRLVPKSCRPARRTPTASFAASQGTATPETGCRLAQPSAGRPTRHHQLGA